MLLLLFVVLVPGVGFRSNGSVGLAFVVVGILGRKRDSTDRVHSQHYSPSLGTPRTDIVGHWKTRGAFVVAAAFVVVAAAAGLEKSVRFGKGNAAIQCAIAALAGLVGRIQGGRCCIVEINGHVGFAETEGSLQR